MLEVYRSGRPTGMIALRVRLGPLTMSAARQRRREVHSRKPCPTPKPTIRAIAISMGSRLSQLKRKCRAVFGGGPAKSSQRSHLPERKRPGPTSNGGTLGGN
jgi:hypothetical protein